MRRALVLVLTLYVLADLAWPLMPGSVSFDPDDCVEAVVTPVRENTAVVTPELVPAPLALYAEVVPAPVAVVQPVAPTIGSRRPVVRRAHFVPSESSSEPADH